VVIEFIPSFEADDSCCCVAEIGQHGLTGLALLGPAHRRIKLSNGRKRAEKVLLTEKLTEI
jgi:hypothetical protein